MDANSKATVCVAAASFENLATESEKEEQWSTNVPIRPADESSVTCAMEGFISLLCQNRTAAGEWSTSGCAAAARKV
jgi:hypothetical protein